MLLPTDIAHEQLRRRFAGDNNARFVRMILIQRKQYGSVRGVQTYAAVRGRSAEARTS